MLARRRDAGKLPALRPIAPVPQRLRLSDPGMSCTAPAVMDCAAPAAHILWSCRYG